jgi:hypothetical protein
LWAVAVRPNPWKDVSTLQFIIKRKKNTNRDGRKLTNKEASYAADMAVRAREA